MSETDKKPRNFKELLEKFMKQKNQTKAIIEEVAPQVAEEVMALGSDLVEIGMAAPGVAAEAVKKGYRAEVDRIDQEFGEADTRADQAQSGVEEINQTNAQEQKNWQGKYQAKGQGLRDAVGTVSRGETTARNFASKVMISGARGFAKVAGVLRQGKLGKKVQDFAEKKAKSTVENMSYTKKAQKTTQEIWGVQARAAGVADRTQRANINFEVAVNDAEKTQAQNAKNNNRSARGEEFVKNVGKAGLRIRSLFQKAEMGVQGKVGQAIAGVFKAKKNDVKKAQEATYARHKVGLKSPREVEVAQGIMNGIYTVEDRMGDAKTWVDGRVDDAKEWTKGKAQAAQKAVKSGVETAELVAMLGADKVKDAKDTVVLGAMLGADKVRKTATSARDTVVIGAMLGADKAKGAVISIADAGIGAAATTAALAELAGEKIVDGSVALAGKAQEGVEKAGKAVAKKANETVQKVSETESKAKVGFFKFLSGKAHSVLDKVSKGVKSIDVAYGASTMELQVKQTNLSEKGKQAEARDEEK